MKSKLLAILFTGAMLFGIVGSVNATVIDIGGSDFMGAFGENFTHTFGQTFSLNVGDDPILDSVTFHIEEMDLYGLDNIDFAFYVYEWDGSKITGDSLFTSGPMATQHQSGYETFTVDLGGVGLSIGTDYVFFVSVIGFLDGESDGGWMAANWYNPYPNGSFVYAYESDFDNLSLNAWNTLLTYADLVYTMELSSPAPEPATMLLLASGLVGLLGLGRRKFFKRS